jgi:hypothetical protein
VLLHAYNLRTQEAEPGGFSLRQPGLQSKNGLQKRKTATGGVAQVLQCLPSKGEALSSNPQYCTPPKKKSKKENKMTTEMRNVYKCAY